MPKERIVDECRMYDIVVNWKRDLDGVAYVQVGIETSDGASIAAHLTGEGQTPANFTGLWGSFSDEDLKKLIKVLQKARRQVYK